VTQQDIDWILAQDTQVLNLYRNRFTAQARPSFSYQQWSKEMGSSAWLDVLKGLADKWNDCNGRAERHNFSFSLKLKDLADQWLKQRGLCAVTGFLMTFESGSIQVRNPYRCSVDRIDSRKGYTPTNIRLTTHWANNAFNTWDNQLFEQMVLAAAERIQLRG